MFKVGDRVMAVEGCHHYYPAGALGSVLNVDDCDYYVDFDEAIGVHVKADGTRHWYVTEVIAAPVTPTSRSNDPATSKGKRRINKYEQAVLSCLASGPKTGKEMVAICGFPLNSITPRLAPLRRKGLIKAKQVLIDGAYQNIKRDKQIVWVLA